MSQIISAVTEIRPGRNIRIIHIDNASEKTLFFLHGLGGRAEQFQAQIDFFKQGYNIVAPDLLGQGQSEKPVKNANTIYSFAEQNKDIQTIFTRYQTKENYLIGHSYGGGFAAYLALQNHDKIKKLILITPICLQPSNTIPKLIHLPLFVLNLIRPLYNKSLIKIAFDSHTNRELISREMAISMMTPMYMIKAAALGLAKIPAIDISKITQPTLILTVERDGLLPPKHVFDFYQRLPNVQFQKVPNASHFAIMEQPEKVNELINNFLLN